ncbi:hypothetical protein [Saccharopolyspora mangrovi]|uniref:Uncharacterized protein n=1 Tax=Saccharopolyspora mangrovi TaxID=3082379 RepID=A0ABU6AH42_9PSEU|nr:hypothetical protein [Saccharopolyspora sp. S2-29]MEB3370884.1 hypothetical protein [Saccharopolyspora sp. S2-29]
MGPHQRESRTRPPQRHAARDEQTAAPAPLLTTTRTPRTRHEHQPHQRRARLEFRHEPGTWATTYR